MNNVEWDQIISILYEVIKSYNIKVTIWKGIIIKTIISERYDIPKQVHNSPVGGHKGINKTFARYSYYWKNMKYDVQDFMNNCLQCKLKKLTRQEVKQEMIFTDTLGSAIDKIAVDLTGPFKVTENEQ